MIDLGVTNADGRFSARIANIREPQFLVAHAEGFGCDFVRVDPKVTAIELRLVPDHVIRGRLVDTQGKPVAGATVRMAHLFVYTPDPRDTFLTAWQNSPQVSVPNGLKEMWVPEASLFTATTDKDGGFSLHGPGVERLVGLRVSGSGIADQKVWVANREGYAAGPAHTFVRKDALETRWRLYGPNLNLVTETEKPIRGVVHATDIGKGLAGVEVRLLHYGESPIPFLLKATTDAVGRYELRGVRKAKHYALDVEANVDTGYPGYNLRAMDTPGYGPLTVDVRMVRGITLTGRVLDRKTGKVEPDLMSCSVSAVILSDNAFAKDYPELVPARISSWLVSAQEGSYKIVTVPGRVLLMASVNGLEATYRYKQAAPDPGYPSYFSEAKGDGGYLFSAYGNGQCSLSGNWCKVLDLKPGTSVVQQDILLEPAAVYPLHLRDSAGKALTGVLAAGVSERKWYSPVTCKTDACDVYDLQKGQSRLVALFEPVRKLAAVLTLNGPEKPNHTVTLRPAATIKGRLLDEENQPRGGVEVDLFYQQGPGNAIHRTAHRFRRILTASDGSFVVDSVLPSLEFGLAFRQPGKTFELTRISEGNMTLAPGETKDLGNLELKPAERRGQ